MKNLRFVVLAILTVFAVSCGNKNDSGGSSNTFSQDPYKVSNIETAYVNPNTYIIQIGSKYYAPTQQSGQVMAAAIQLASTHQIPLNAQGMLKASLSGSMALGMMPQQNPQYAQQQGLSPQSPILITLTSMVIRR